MSVIHALFNPGTIRVADWAFTLLAAAGVGICCWTATDAQLDLRARARAGLNGSLLVAGLIARRGALASGTLHLGFLVIGTTALMGRLPPPALYSRAVLLAAVFIVAQSAVVYAQLRHQVDRIRLRRKRPLTEETHA